MIQDYERYRAEYERLRENLLQRDHRAEQDPNGDKMQEGFFIAFRSIGLPS